MRRNPQSDTSGCFSGDASAPRSIRGPCRALSSRATRWGTRLEQEVKTTKVRTHDAPHHDHSPCIVCVCTVHCIVPSEIVANPSRRLRIDFHVLRVVHGLDVPARAISTRATQDLSASDVDPVVTDIRRRHSSLASPMTCAEKPRGHHRATVDRVVSRSCSSAVFPVVEPTSRTLGEGSVIGLSTVSITLHQIVFVFAWDWRIL